MDQPKLGPLLLSKSVIGRTEVRVIVTGELPIFTCLHNRVLSTYGKEDFVLGTQEGYRKQKQSGARV